MRKRIEGDFFSLFDEKTGMYLRSGVIKDGKDTGKDPFMSSFPELVDVGIMGRCSHGLSGLCMGAGVECYQSGGRVSAPNMLLEDFRSIERQCAGRTYLFALGGRGDPDEHEEFEGILAECLENRITPNFTTSGMRMTPKKAALCAEYCGAVAVSWYRSEYTLNAIKMLIGAGVKTNIHYVISEKTLDEAIRLLEGGFPDGVNAVLFLLHKPVGQGTRESMVRIGDERFDRFLRLAAEASHPFKVGFDSCTVPAIVSGRIGVAQESLDACEAARWSCYVSSDMRMLPCSFDARGRWAVSLRENTIEEAWHSPQFEDFRRRFKEACPGCGKRDQCLGGCPIVPEATPCRDRAYGEVAELKGR